MHCVQFTSELTPNEKMYIRFENTHRMEDFLHQNNAVRIRNPDIRRASVYYY